MDTQTIKSQEKSTKTTERISGSEAIVRCLIEEGVDILYGYPGGAIMPVYDELYKYQDKIHHVLTRHEQGATHSAQGYARISGRVGRNVKEMFEKTLQNFRETHPETKADVGGNKYAAGCFIESIHEPAFIENLQKVLEIEEIKIH